MSKAIPQPPTFDQVRDAAQAAGYEFIRIGANEYERPERIAKDEWRTWDAEIASGWSYMTGDYHPDYPLAFFLRDYTSRLTGWYRLAFAYCMDNPKHSLIVQNRRKHWLIQRRGEYVDFSLPHQDHGGEKNYVSRDGKTKVWVNND